MCAYKLTVSEYGCIPHERNWIRDSDPAHAVTQTQLHIRCDIPDPSYCVLYGAFYNKALLCCSSIINQHHRYCVGVNVCVAIYISDLIKHVCEAVLVAQV